MSDFSKERADAANKKAVFFLDSFKGSYGVPCKPFSEELELNLIAGISQMIRDQDDDTKEACILNIRGCEPINGRINIDLAVGCVISADGLK